MAEIAIAIAVSAAIGVAQNALTPKPKRPRVDKGRADDIRIMTSEEGVFIPIVKGWARVAPNIIWHTDIVESTQTQTVGGGGKGIGGGQTEEERTFSYVTSLCCAISAGPVWNGLRRIWADNEVILNLPGDNGGYYEGEDAANTRTGTSTVESYDAASGRQELTLNPGASVQFNSVVSHGAKTRPFTFYARTGAVTTYEIYVNGVLVSTSSFPNTGDSVYQTRTLSVALLDGLNTIKIKNTSPTFNLGIDRIFVFPGFADDNQVTGIVSEDDFAVVASNPDEPKAFYNVAPIIDPGDGGGGGGGGGFGGGSGSGTLTGLGGAQFFFYLGTEDQPQDATMVAEDGETEVPAYREVFYCLIKDMLLKDARLPNLTFEFDEGTHDLAVAVTDYYKEADARDSELDMSELEGIHFIGHVIDALRPLEDSLTPLEQWYGFDLLPIDGKIKAVLRGGPIVETIPEASLAAYEEGSEPPAGPILIDYIDPSLLPRDINVNYLEVAKDYHNATEPVSRAVGLNQNPESVNFPIVAESDEAVQVGLRLLYEKYLARPVEFTTGPEFHRLAPTNPVTLALSNISHRVRITGKQAPPGGGLIRWKGVTENVGVYTQVMAPGIGGFEPPVVDYPANSVFVIIDAPLVRPEDAGDGTSPVIILDVCKRGTTRPWRGGVAFKEEIEDEWRRETTFSVNSTIGVMRSPLADIADPNVFDRTNTFTVDFWNPTTFESFEESELEKKANINLFWVGVNGGQGEYVQAAIATQVAPSAGFATAYTFSILLRGRFLTEYATPGHGSDEFFVVMDSTCKPRRCDLKELRATRRWVAASVGQGINEALTVSEVDFTLQGNSLKPPTVANARSTHDSENDKLIEFEGRTRKGGGLRSGQGGAIHEEAEVYKVQPVGTSRVMEVKPGTQLAAILLSSGGSFAGCNQNSFEPSDFGLTARTYQEVPGPDNSFEGTLQADVIGGSPVALGLQLQGGSWKSISSELIPLGLTMGSTVTGNLAIPYLVVLEPRGSFEIGLWQRLHVYEYGTRIFSASDKSGESDHDPDFGWAAITSGESLFRIRFNFVGSSVRIQKAHAASVPFTTIATGSRAAVFPVFGIAAAAGNPGDKVLGITLSTYPFPKTIYAHSQQEEDGFTPGEPIEFDIWQHSPLVGAGHKKRVTL
jgi:Putative phage tail protein